MHRVVPFPRPSALAALGILGVLGCGAAGAPAPGQVMLALETDGGAGRSLDFVRIAVVVTDERTNGRVVKTYALTPAALPGTVALVASEASGAKAKVEVFATDARDALRVYQAARVTIPGEGVRVLRVKLEATCDGIFPQTSCPVGTASCAESPRVACQADHACLEGRCVPVQEFSTSDMPPYDAARAAACEPESESAICTRRGIPCGSYVLTDTCGAPRVVRCGACGGETAGTTATLEGPGLDDCGPLGADACGRSILVSGGTFDPGVTRPASASVSDFRLDKYELTVGRFRKFVDAWLAGWRPAPGSGKHAHLNGGRGLAIIGGGFEAGWNAAWSSYVGAPNTVSVVPSGSGAKTRDDWDKVLGSGNRWPTWTSAASANERRPMNTLSWYDLLAFCIWDGGFLPSRAEWVYASTGGSESRIYPWGNQHPGGSTARAVYDCLWWNPAGGPNECTLDDIAPVGSVPSGDGRWGQSDLAGSVWEWLLDFSGPLPADACVDCVRLDEFVKRSQCGAAFSTPSSYLTAKDCVADAPAVRTAIAGGRCARRP